MSERNFGEVAGPALTEVGLSGIRSELIRSTAELDDQKSLECIESLLLNRSLLTQEEADTYERMKTEIQNRRTKGEKEE